MREPWAYESLKEGNIYVRTDKSYPWHTHKIVMIMSIDWSSGMSPSYKVYCVNTDGTSEIRTWTRNNFTYMDRLSEAG